MIYEANLYGFPGTLVTASQPHPRHALFDAGYITLRGSKLAIAVADGRGTIPGTEQLALAAAIGVCQNLINQSRHTDMQQAYKDTLITIQHLNPNLGTTLTTALIEAGGKVTCGLVGDSRAIKYDAQTQTLSNVLPPQGILWELARANNHLSATPLLSEQQQLSAQAVFDTTTSDAQRRSQLAQIGGGFLGDPRNITYIMDNLSFGANSIIPSAMQYKEAETATTTLASGDWLILSSDGIFDALPFPHIATLISHGVQQGNQPIQIVDELFSIASQQTHKDDFFVYAFIQKINNYKPTDSLTFYLD